MRRLSRPRWRGHGPRRVAAIPPEQQDRFVEPLGTQRSNLAHPTGTLDPRDQSGRGLAPLLDSGPLQMGHPGQLRSTEPPIHLDPHGTPAVEHRALGGIAGRALGPVPVKPLQIEQPCTESEHPPLDGARSNAGTPGGARHGSFVGERLRHGRHDDLDPGDLARQRIAGQHPLAVPARSAACERHGQRHERVECLEPALHSTASKLEITTLTASATTIGEELIACMVDNCRVVATFDIEYENHVLMTAPG